MVKFFSQSHKYDDAWQTVTLAFFLRYPNPYASHVLSCDVISRTITPSGALLTTRLILKKGALPKWFPEKFVSRAETWVVEESEVDPDGRVVRCKTRNLDHVKVMQVHEDVELHEAENGMTIQKTTASVVSNFGWGLTKRIEKYGVTKFKSNLERSREGISLVLSLIRDSRARMGLPLTMVADPGRFDTAFASNLRSLPSSENDVPRMVSLASAGDVTADVADDGRSAVSNSSVDNRGWLARWGWRRPPSC